MPRKYKRKVEKNRITEEMMDAVTTIGEKRASVYNTTLQNPIYQKIF